jgi:hypothetical protein
LIGAAFSSIRFSQRTHYPNHPQASGAAGVGKIIDHVLEWSGGNRSTFLRPRIPKVKKKQAAIPNKKDNTRSPSRKNTRVGLPTNSPIPKNSKEKAANPVLWRRLSDSPFFNHDVLKPLD